jgi:ferredoxin
MRTTASTCLTCTCEGTMPLDATALGGVDAGGRPAHQLCRAQLDRFRGALAEFDTVTVTCTQEAPLFRETAEEEDFGGILNFVNIRETAGWSDEAAQAGPKMAALIAMAGVAAAPFRVTTLESQGVVLILGRDETAIEAGRQLAEALDVTVLLAPGAQVTPPRETLFPVLQGRARRVEGVLGSYEVTVDGYAAPDPSSRARLEFGPTVDGAVSRCDLIVDLTGGTPLVAAPDLRPGYLRADPRDPVALARTLAKAAGMVGTFDKPAYIDFRADLCAHSRNRKTGCTRCLSLCPTGAIEPAGDTVVIDPGICAGCGACAAACPTGAAAYALPDATALVGRLRAGLAAWHAAGGKVAPVLLIHDALHGAALIDAAARFGRGLPATVIPMAVNEVTQVGPEVLAAALAYGAGAVRLLTRARPKHDLEGLEDTLALIDLLAAAAGHDEGVVALIQTDDPDALEEALRALPRAPLRAHRSSFLPAEGKRDLLVAAVSEMSRTAPAPLSEALPLPRGAPFGTVNVNAGSCTLCMACVGACPAGALLDNPETPMLRFTETACVQCGICEATCPEQAITLDARIDIAAWDAPRRVLHLEEPFGCTACGTPFGTRSGIERILGRLSEHWMFAGEAGQARRTLLTLCPDCRTKEVVMQGFDPHDPDALSGPPKPRAG